MPLLTGAARVLDVGTGSGALAIALAHERPELLVTAIDLSAAALAVAVENACRNAVAERIDFVPGDLATLPGGPFELMVANPPYIPSGDLATLMPEVRDFEPHLALDGGADGLAAYRALARQAGTVLAPGRVAAGRGGDRSGGGGAGAVCQRRADGNPCHPRLGGG